MSIEVNGSAAISWTLSGWGLRLVAMLTELLIHKQSCITVAWNGKTGTNNFAFLTKKDFEVFLLFFWVFYFSLEYVGLFLSFFAFRKVSLLEREKQRMMTKQVRSIRNTWSAMKRKKMMINIKEAQKLIFFFKYIFIYILYSSLTAKM